MFFLRFLFLFLLYLLPSFSLFILLFSPFSPRRHFCFLSPRRCFFFLSLSPLFTRLPVEHLPSDRNVFLTLCLVVYSAFGNYRSKLIECGADARYRVEFAFTDRAGYFVRLTEDKQKSRPFFSLSHPLPLSAGFFSPRDRKDSLCFGIRRLFRFGIVPFAGVFHPRGDTYEKLDSLQG